MVGAVESACAIKGQPLEALSVQQVIDCSYSNYGCNGGSPLNALNWLNKVTRSTAFEAACVMHIQNSQTVYSHLLNNVFRVGNVANQSLN